MEFKCFSDEEVKVLFLAKCQDLNIKIRDNLEGKFIEHCNKKCINRVADFSEVKKVFTNKIYFISYNFQYIINIKQNIHTK